jgi:hypothetical protein
MQLVVFELLSGVVSGVIRHVYDSVKNAWVEAESNKDDELALAPIAIRQPDRRTVD